MGVKFTADGAGTDRTAGGGLNATNWSKTFTDYVQAHTTGQYYAHSGGANYQATLHMPFYYGITVLPRTDPGTGSYDSDGANRYYPVSFAAGGVRRASAMPNLVIMRNYGAAGPYQFEVNNSVDIGWTGSSTHQGGLYAAFHTGDSAWSDMYESQVTRYRYTYHQTISSYGMRLSYSLDRGAGPFYVMLRGGFDYIVAASYPCLPTQVTAGGSVFTHSGNTSYQTWPDSTTTAGSTFASNITNMG
jgi:hypothetical protein